MSTPHTTAPERPFNDRDWAEDAAHENGNYQNKCANCGTVFIGHKRRVWCKVCATAPPRNAERTADADPLPSELCDVLLLARSLIQDRPGDFTEEEARYRTSFVLDRINRVLGAHARAKLSAVQAHCDAAAPAPKEPS